MRGDGLFTSPYMEDYEDDFDESVDPDGLDWYDTIQEWEDAQLA